MKLNNKKIDLVFFTIKYYPQDTKETREYLIVGWDLNIDEIVYSEHSTLRSRFATINLENIWKFACDYSNNYNKITGFSKKLSNDIFVVQAVVEAHDSLSRQEFENYLDDLRMFKRLNFWSYFQAPQRSIIKIMPVKKEGLKYKEIIENDIFFIPNKEGILNIVSYFVNIGKRIDELKTNPLFMEPISLTKKPVYFTAKEINTRLHYKLKSIVEETTGPNLEFNGNLEKYNNINFNDYISSSNDHEV
jgi:hypothetical protein